MERAGKLRASQLRGGWLWVCVVVAAPVRIARFSRVYRRDTPVDSILRPRFVVKVSLGCEVVELSQAQ